LDLPRGCDIKSGRLILKQGGGYSVQGNTSKTVQGRSVKFEVQFTHVGRIKLEVEGHIRWDDGIYRECSVSVEQSVEVRSPFCRRGTKRPEYILVRNEVSSQLDKWFEQDQAPMLWLRGLPQVGKTTVIREWQKQHPRQVLYLKLSRRSRHCETWHAWAAGEIVETSQAVTIDDVKQYWDAVKSWCAGTDGKGVLIMDQAEAAYKRDGPDFTQFLVDTLHLAKELKWDSKILKWIVIDTLSIEDRPVGEKVEESRYDEVVMRPFSLEELRKYVTEIPIPDGFVLSTGMDERVIDKLHNMSGGHPLLVNAYLCHTQKLYEEDQSQSAARTIASLLPTLEPDVGGEIKEISRAAAKLWKKYKAYVLKERSQPIENFVHDCPRCATITDTGKCDRRSGVDGSLKATLQKTLLCDENHPCPVLSPWVAYTITQGDGSD
jgi:hypothetical protein